MLDDCIVVLVENLEESKLEPVGRDLKYILVMYFRFHFESKEGEKRRTPVVGVGV